MGLKQQPTKQITPKETYKKMKEYPPEMYDELLLFFRTNRY